MVLTYPILTTVSFEKQTNATAEIKTIVRIEDNTKPKPTLCISLSSKFHVA